MAINEENNPKNIISIIKKLAISKRLNFLIGSGVTSRSIGTLETLTKEAKLIDIKLDDWLIEKVKKISINLLEDDVEKINEIDNDLDDYIYFLKSVIEVLNLSNSRQTPKSVNIFTTNYDLFIEKALDTISEHYNFILNDGAKGYFRRILDSSNYNRVVSYKGLNDNYISEIPSISLIKPHGSVNWSEYENKIMINSIVEEEPVIVRPTGSEEKDTFGENHFFEMLRIFQLELDKPQSVLFIIGFSFQDQHILKMIKRALKNPELIVYVFGYVDENRDSYEKKLGDITPSNLKIITPDNFKNANLRDDERFSIYDLATILNGTLVEKEPEEESSEE